MRGSLDPLRSPLARGVVAIGVAALSLAPHSGIAHADEPAAPAVSDTGIDKALATPADEPAAPAVSEPSPPAAPAKPPATEHEGRFSFGSYGRVLAATDAEGRPARDTDIVAMQSELDELAYDFGTAVNTAHTAGLDLNGNPGTTFFIGAPGPLPPPPTPGAATTIRVEPTIVADPDLLAAADATSPPPGGNAVALAMSALQSTSIGVPPSGTPGERVADFAGKLGSRIAGSESESVMRESTRAHAEELLEGATGVSLDEEMVNLTKFQRAFEASMRVLQIADEMLTQIVERL